MRNWKMIPDGDVFESLVGSLLMAENRGIIAFNRPGPDSGIDSISFDRTHVYQAKFHDDGKMASAIDSAKDEFKKIVEYRKPEHRNFKFWKDVTEWSLVGNFPINPTDEAKWREQIVPEFEGIGITAHFISREELDVRLDKNPEIDRSFFGGHRRTLIYLPEARKYLASKSRNGSFFATEMIGRESSVAEVLRFAESQEERVLSVVGAYCSGKTRFLYEAMLALANAGWRVFWGLGSSMCNTDAWFDSLMSSVKTCVFLDDPKDAKIVDSMIEQLAASERSNWKLVFACSCERDRIIAPEYTTNALFKKLKLPLLTHEDVSKIVAQYPGLNGHPPSIDGVAEMARGLPSLLCLILEFYRQNKQLALPPDSLTLMRSYVENSCKILDPPLRAKANLVLRWVSAWDGIAVRNDGEDNPKLDYLSSLGVDCNETMTILKGLSTSGLVDAWKMYGNNCYRVQPALIRRHILGTWLLEDEGGAFRVSSDGGELIKNLLERSVPEADKIFQILPAVLGSYLHAEDEAERLFRPVFNHLKDRTANGDIDEQYDIIDMLGKIGCFAQESTLALLRSIFANPRPESDLVTHWDIIREISKTLAGVAEFVRDRPVAVQYMRFFKEIYESTVDDSGQSNSKRDEIAKNLSSVVNHFGELRHFPDIALSLVMERLRCGDMSEHPFEQMLAKQMLEAERQSFGVYTRRTVTFCRRAIREGAREWNRAVAIREALVNALDSQSVATEREVLWGLFGKGFLFARNLCGGFIDHGHQATTDAARRMVVGDLVYLKDALENDVRERSVRELQLMRSVWEWEREFGEESEVKSLAETCEKLFVGKLGFPFQDLVCWHSDAHEQCVRNVADQFLHAKSADEIEAFLGRTAEYLCAANGGAARGISGHSFHDIAGLCCDGYDFEGADPISEFTLRCLRRFDAEHPLSVAFARIQIGNFIRKRKSVLDQGKFATLFDRIYSRVEGKDYFLFSLYEGDTGLFLGQHTEVEFEHLIASTMSPLDLARVLPYWIGMDPTRVLKRLSDALEEARNVGGASCAVLRTIVGSLYFAFQGARHLDEAIIPLEWIVERFNDGYADSSLLIDHEFVELCKLKHEKLGMSVLFHFLESWIQRSRTGECGYLDEERFEPQELFELDDVSAFNKVCELVFVDGGIHVRMILGRIFAAIDSEGENVFNFVVGYMKSHSCSGREELSRLAMLGAYGKANEVTKATLRMICDRCMMLNYDDRTYVYHYMMPDEHGASWCGDKVPGRYLDARKSAQALFDNEPEDSSLRDFYKYCVDRASGTVKMISDNIESWRHE